MGTLIPEQLSWKCWTVSQKKQATWSYSDSLLWSVIFPLESHSSSNCQFPQFTAIRSKRQNSGFLKVISETFCANKRPVLNDYKILWQIKKSSESSKRHLNKSYRLCQVSCEPLHFKSHLMLNSPLLSALCLLTRVHPLIDLKEPFLSSFWQEVPMKSPCFRYSWRFLPVAEIFAPPGQGRAQYSIKRVIFTEPC